MDKNFDKWNYVKKKIDSIITRRDLYFNVGEVWWCSVGYIPKEQYSGIINALIAILTE